MPMPIRRFYETAANSEESVMRVSTTRARVCFAFALIAAWPLLMSAAPKTQKATCYVVAEEGDSAEANDLYLRMLSSSQAVAFVAPTRFSFGSGSTFTSVDGSFSFEGGQPSLVDRKGKLALYSISVSFRVDAFPKAVSTPTIDLKIADLMGSSGIVQPGAKAIELAAAKAKLKSGVAWIISMKMPDKKTIRVKVGLAR
jgi:hypothetical protein